MTVVECGSGSSTVWLAAACRSRGRGRVVALEHDESYAAQTAAALADNGLSDLAEVRHAPLESVQLDGEPWRWYERGAWADLRAVDVLFVDGPPGVTGPLARYPALPLLAETLQDGALVVLDDTHRSDESEILSRWQQEGPRGRLGDADRVGRSSLARWHVSGG